MIVTAPPIVAVAAVPILATTPGGDRIATNTMVAIILVSCFAGVGVSTILAAHRWKATRRRILPQKRYPNANHLAFGDGSSSVPPALTVDAGSKGLPMLSSTHETGSLHDLGIATVQKAGSSRPHLAAARQAPVLLRPSRPAPVLPTRLGA